MKYEGKVYGKVAGRYIELTQTIEDLENEIAVLKAQPNFPSIDSIYHSHLDEMFEESETMEEAYQFGIYITRKKFGVK